MVCRMALYKVKPTVACMIRRSNFLFFKAKITCEARGVDLEFRDCPQNGADFLDKIMRQNKEIKTMSDSS
jgi:hypothetical protein